MINLRFSRLRAANLARQRQYPPYDWNLEDWLIATGGEVGEALNVVKKLRREECGLPGNTRTRAELRADLGDELADAAIYLDLLMSAAKLGFLPGLRYDAGLSDIAIMVDAALADAPPDYRADIRDDGRDLLRCLGELAEAVATEDAEELQVSGDTLMASLFGMARSQGIDLGAAIISKFNRTSEKLGFPERLAV